MNRRRAPLTDSDERRATRWRRVAVTGAVTLMVVVGAGWLLLDRSTPSARQATGLDGSAPSASPSPVVDGVPEGFPHTSEGARQAAMALVTVEAGPLMADPAAYRTAWRQMCTPDYYASAGRAAAETVLSQQEANNHLVSNAAHGQRVYERAVPLTAVVVSGGEDAATVRTWSLLIQHPGDGPTTVAFAAGVMQLRWTESQWRLDGGGGLPSLDDGTSGPLQISAGPLLPAYLDAPERDHAPPA